MLILGQRIQRTVRAQAAERLQATLEILQDRIVSDAEQLKYKIEMLAHDPELRRLYLVESANPGALNQYLAGQQSLLDLDYLWVTDTTSILIGDASAAVSAPLRRLGDPVTEASMADPSSSGVRLVPTAGHRVTLDANAAISYGEARVGRVRGGIVLDSTMLARLTRSSGVELFLHEVGGPLGASTLGEIPELSRAGVVPERVSLRGGVVPDPPRTPAVGGTFTWWGWPPPPRRRRAVRVALDARARPARPGAGGVLGGVWSPGCRVGPERSRTSRTDLARRVGRAAGWRACATAGARTGARTHALRPRHLP